MAIDWEKISLDKNPSTNLNQGDMAKILNDLQRIQQLVVSRFGEISAEFRQVYAEVLRNGAEIKTLREVIAAISSPTIQEKSVEKILEKRIWTVEDFRDSSPVWNKLIEEILEKVLKNQPESPEILENTISEAWIALGTKKIQACSMTVLGELISHCQQIIFPPTSIEENSSKQERRRGPGRPKKNPVTDSDSKQEKPIPSARTFIEVCKDLQIDFQELQKDLQSIAAKKSPIAPLTSDGNLATWVKQAIEVGYGLLHNGKARFPEFETNLFWGFVKTAIAGLIRNKSNNN